MLIVLSHTTAFFFWRTFTRNRNHLKPAIPASGMTERLMWKQQYAVELAQLGIVPTETNPLHLLFADQKLRPKPNTASLPPIRPHVQPAPLPAGSVLRLTEHIAVVSPELCFLQMAARLTTAQLVHAGFELCGIYALLPDPARPGKTKPVKRRQLTTAADLTAILAHPVARRNPRARIAVAHILDRAASPMEARVAMLLCLPSGMGGYGLPQPVLNPDLSQSPEAQTLYPHLTVRPDLFWPAAHLDVEYDGGDHEGELSRTKDNGRREALEAGGVKVMTLTYPQVVDDAAFDVLARRIARKVGAPVRIRMEDGRHAALRAALRRELEL